MSFAGTASSEKRPRTYIQEHALITRKHRASKYNQGTENFEGILIKKMGRYLVFRSVLGYTECFLKVDFIIGQYHIEEVR